MKQKLLSVFLVLLLLSLALTACGRKTPQQTTKGEVTTPEITTPDSSSTPPLAESFTLTNEYTIVYDTSSRELAFTIWDALRAAGFSLPAPMSDSTVAVSDHEILVGATNRPEHAAVLSAVAELRGENEDIALSLICTVNEKIALYAVGLEAQDRLSERFTSRYIGEMNATFPKDLRDSDRYSISALLAARREEAVKEYNAAVEEEMKEYALRWERSGLEEEQIAVLQKMYTLFGEELILWMAGLYDTETGGFYYSESARDYSGFLPDVEDTAFVLGNLTGQGILFADQQDMLDRLAFWGMDDFDVKVVRWVQSLQDPQNKFFYHPQWENRITDVGLFRHYNNALGILSRFGASPLYGKTEGSAAVKNPFVYLSGSASNTLPPYMQSEEALLEWLNSFNWGNGATYGSASVVGEMADTLKRIGLIDVVIDFFDAKLRDNGTFEDEVNMASLNGIMKVCKLYRAAGRPFIKFDAVLNATLTVMQNDEVPDLICSVANPWTVLYTLKYMTEEQIADANAEIARLEKAIAEESNPAAKSELESALASQRIKLEGAEQNLASYHEKVGESYVSIVEKSYERFSIFKKKDGGFSMLPSTCGGTAVGVQWALLLPESDVNGTNLAVSTLGLLFSCIDATRVQMYSPETREKVVQILVNAKPIEKTQMTEFDKDYPLEELPDGSFDNVDTGIVTSGNGASTIVSNGENKYLTHTSLAGGTSTLRFNFNSSSGINYYEFTFDFNIESSSNMPGGMMQLYFGRAYMLVFGASETHFTVGEANTNAPGASGGAEYVSRRFDGSFLLNKWYTMTVKVAIHEDGTAQFLTYLGEMGDQQTLLANSTLFYNQELHTEVNCDSFITNLYFYPWSKCELALSIDNMTVHGNAVLPEELPALPKAPEQLGDSVRFDFEDATVGEEVKESFVIYKNSETAVGYIRGDSANKYVEYASPAGTNTAIGFDFGRSTSGAGVSLQFDMTIAEAVVGNISDVFFGNSYKWVIEVHDDGTFTVWEDNNSEKRMFFTSLAVGKKYTVTLVTDPTSDTSPISVTFDDGTTPVSATTAHLRGSTTKETINLGRIDFNIWSKMEVTLLLDNLILTKN